MYIVTYKIGNKSYDYQIKANTSKEQKLLAKKELKVQNSEILGVIKQS